jgi:hypothetical protein
MYTYTHICTGWLFKSYTLNISAMFYYTQVETFIEIGTWSQPLREWDVAALRMSSIRQRRKPGSSGAIPGLPGASDLQLVTDHCTTHQRQRSRWCEHYPGRWTGQNRPVVWPPRSPDVTLADITRGAIWRASFTPSDVTTPAMRCGIPLKQLLHFVACLAPFSWPRIFGATQLKYALTLDRFST